jgi:hypothetical protein
VAECLTKTGLIVSHGGVEVCRGAALADWGEHVGDGVESGHCGLRVPLPCGRRSHVLCCGSEDREDKMSPYGLKARALVSVADKVLQKIEDERKKGGMKKNRQQKFSISSAQY